MGKMKEKEYNVTEPENAVLKTNVTDGRDQNDFIMLPTVDFCFKELMQNEKVRKGIIAAILGNRPEEVEEAVLMPTILRKEYEDDKYGVLDVLVKLKGGTRMDFEMQLVYFEFWENRTLYYLSKMYTDQIKEGEDYDVLKKCIQVSIFDHVYFEADDRCYRRITFRDNELKEEYTDLMEIHILELPKLPMEQKNETDLMQWMRFLRGKSREDFEKMAEKNPEMKEAYEMLDRMSADEKKRLEYEARQKLLREKNMILKDGKRKYERGLREGRAEERICLVKRLYDKGMNSAQISELIGLDKDQVEEMLQTKSNFENNGQ